MSAGTIPEDWTIETVHAERTAKALERVAIALERIAANMAAPQTVYTHEIKDSGSDFATIPRVLQHVVEWKPQAFVSDFRAPGGETCRDTGELCPKQRMTKRRPYSVDPS